MEKWPILDQNYGLTPLEKCHFFDVLNFLFLWPKKAFFCSRISQKTFSWPILPKKKKLERGLFLDENHGLTPLQKCQFFDFFELLVFIYSLERVFFVVEYRKRHFSALYYIKKKLKKGPFLDQNHGLTPLEKCQFFDFLNFWFLWFRKRFFVLE